MYGFKKIASLLLIFSICTCGNFAQAATSSTQTYKETTLTLPEEYSKDKEKRCISVSAYKNQIHLILEGQGPDGALRYSHYLSSDGGKTWNSQDMNWLSEAIKKAGVGSFTQISIDVAKDGSVYAFFDAEGKVETPALTYGYFKGKLIKHAGGKTTELLTLDNSNYGHYEPLGMTMSSGNNLVLKATGQGKMFEEMTGKKSLNSILSYDKTTGKQKSAVENKDGRVNVVSYVNDRYIVWENDAVKIYDIKTGNLLSTLKQTSGAEDDNFMLNWAAGPDGAFYKMDGAGVMRTEQYTAWEKILGAEACKKGTAGSTSTQCQTLFIGEDGSIYVLLKHTNYEQGKESTKAITFNRYTPQ